jgi:hypothetical protein
MATDKQRGDAMRLYAGVMEEIKVRLFSIDMAVSGSMELPQQLLHEYSHLQLRMVCELIALSCLVAHGDIQEATSLKNEWSADRILDKLTRLHEHFYPWPVEWLGETPDGTLQFKHVLDGFLTKQELLTLNGRCGDALHRGSLKKLLKPKMPTVRKFPEVADACAKIRKLLEHHRIVLLDNNLIFCNLSDPDNNGRVELAFAGHTPPDETPNAK